jgi:hypothetical protein
MTSLSFSLFQMSLLQKLLTDFDVWNVIEEDKDLTRHKKCTAQIDSISQ